MLEVEQAPDGASLEGDPLQQALILGAAPEPLRPLIENVGEDKDYGVEVTLRGGIPVRFGSGSRAAEKWAVGGAVLAEPEARRAHLPRRPGAGAPGDRRRRRSRRRQERLV